MADSGTGPRDGLTAQALAAKAWELAPFFLEQAPDNEAKGRLNDATFRALVDNGFLGLWIPKEFGGVEAWPLEALEAIEALSYGDGSTGWVLMALEVAMGSAAAYLPSASARHIFGEQMPGIAGQGGPIGRAEVDGDGFRLTGNWRYGSGLLHSEWMHTGALIFENGAPKMLPGTDVQEFRIFILPVEQAELQENWDTLGLRATGSIDYAIRDVFVPFEFTHMQATKTPLQGGATYRLGIQGMGAICHSGFALGVGRRALDELAALARHETGRPTLLPEHGGGLNFHEQYGNAEARYRAARALVYEAQGSIQETLRRGDAPSTRQVTMARLGLNYITTVVAETCTFAYKYGGGISLRNSTLQRCFRDMYSGTQHASTMPIILRECGRELLGLAEGKVWGARTLEDPVALPGG